MEQVHRTFIRGTLILSLAVMISKVLGLIYIIPLKHIIGVEGIALLNRGYIPYTVLLSLSTMGIPLAISKYVAQFNSQGDYRKGKTLLRTFFYLLLAFGFCSAVAVFFLAPYIVRFLGQPEALWTIRAICSALIIVPAMAVLRGYFQGWQSMGPTGLSQVVEQLVRVLFIVISAYILVRFSVEMPITVAVSSLGAAVGAVAGMLVLLYYWYKRRKGIHERVLSTPSSLQSSSEKTMHLYQELIRYAVPVSIMSLAIPLFQLVEWMIYSPILTFLGFAHDQVEVFFGVVTGLAHKLMMIPVSIATAFSLAMVPLVSSLFAKGDLQLLSTQIRRAITILLYIMIPAACGIYILAEPLYVTIYHDAVGVEMLKWYAPAAVAISLYSLSAAMLQGMQQLRWGILSLVLALLVKLVGTPIFSIYFLELGTILATTCGFLVGSISNIIKLKQITQWSLDKTMKDIIRICLASFIMSISVYISKWGWNILGWSEGWLDQFFQLIGGALIGFTIYMLLSWRWPWVQPIIQQLLQKIKLNKTHSSDA